MRANKKNRLSGAANTREAQDRKVNKVMNLSIASLSKKIKHQTLKIKVLIMMLVILAASILFAIQSQPVIHVTPDEIIMKRESLELDTDTTDSILVNLPNGQTLVWGVA
jgi:hypothetical protein